jgi:SNF2 family DNA or RNA helicase
MLIGETRNREEVIRQFQDDPENRFFLISLKAGGVGLNLTAADYVFILDPWWNPAAEMQAISRSHRIGQTQNVFVYRYISVETVEEKIVRLQDRKSELADLFINNNNPFRQISREDILDLFE